MQSLLVNQFLLCQYFATFQDMQDLLTWMFFKSIFWIHAAEVKVNYEFL